MVQGVIELQVLQCKKKYSFEIGYIVISAGLFVQFTLLFVYLYLLLYYSISYYVMDVQVLYEKDNLAWENVTGQGP